MEHIKAKHPGTLFLSQLLPPHIIHSPFTAPQAHPASRAKRPLFHIRIFIGVCAPTTYVIIL